MVVAARCTARSSGDPERLRHVAHATGRTRPVAVALARRGVEADRGGRREVERLGPAVDRHPHDVVERARTASGRPQASLPKTQRSAAEQVGVGQHRASPAPSAARTCRPRAAQRASVAATGRAPVTPAGGTASRRTRARTCRCRRRRGPAEQHGVGARGVGARMTVPALPGSRTWASTRDQARPGVQHGAEVDVERAADRDQPLRGHGLGQRRRSPRRLDPCTRSPAASAAGDAVGVARRGLGRDEDLADTGPAAPPDRLAHRLRALGQERPVRSAPPAWPAPDRLDPLGPRGWRTARRVGRRRPGSGGRPRPGSRAGRLAFATSTSAAKAAGSLTASSASIRRSTSTPAAFRPWMNRL